MKLYTKRGDDGSTVLFGGTRVAKCDLRVAAYGEVDEVSAAIGVALGECTDKETADTLRRIQSDLFTLGAELATPERGNVETPIDDGRILQLERWIDQATAVVTPLEHFVIPAGTRNAAALHLARAVCRRAERATVALARQQPVGPAITIYLNRLSDLLFALARLANHNAGVADIPWIAPKS